MFNAIIMFFLILLINHVVTLANIIKNLIFVMIVKEKIKFFMKIIALKIMTVQVYTKYMI